MNVKLENFDQWVQIENLNLNFDQTVTISQGWPRQSPVDGVNLFVSVGLLVLSKLGVIADARDIAGLLGGHVMGIDQAQPCNSAEPGCQGSLVVPSLLGVLSASVAHAATASKLDTTIRPDQN